MKQLPPRPSLEFLRKEAKQLLARARANDPDALERLRAVTTSGRPSLHHAQHALAKEYGCSSWRDLTIKVRNTETDAFLRLVCGDQWDEAERLPMPPETVRLGNIFVAAACGDDIAVEHILRKDSRRAKEKGGPGDRTALSYLCFSRWNRVNEVRFADTARILLEAGADPNTGFVHPSYPNDPFPALYGAAGVVFNPHLVEVLLEYGADVNDNESLYHSTESRDHTCLKLLLAQKPRFEKSNAHLRMLDYEDVEGLRLIIDAGAPLNEKGTEGMLNHAIRRGRSRPHIEMLIDAGADVTCPSNEGLTPFDNALRNGNNDAVQVLTERGFAPELDRKQRFLAACVAADPDAARATGFKVADLAPSELDLFVEAAWNGKIGPVRTMLDLGFPVDHRSTHGGHTALHAAAWKGNAPIAHLLLDAGIKVGVIEHQFHASEIGWAEHGSHNAKSDGRYLNPNADYDSIIERLQEMGQKAS